MTPLSDFGSRLVAQRPAVEKWLVKELAKQRLPFYCSVDLRISEHKIAPVDANLFPGGFNNIASIAHSEAGTAVRKLIDKQWPRVRRVLLVAERLTRNPYYAVHLGVLQDVLTAGGLEVQLAFIDGEEATLSGHHRKINVGVVRREGNLVSTAGVTPDLILLNHDQSSGVPAILEGLDIEVAPPLEAGWSHRRKSAHFFQYERIVQRFARFFDLDPWLMQAYFNVCSRVDVSKSIGLDCLVRAIEETLADINENYARIGSATKPFVALKADAGTYGMGVVMVDEAVSARSFNRSQRKNLSVIKDGVAVHDILIQEGVPTNIKIEGLVAEPVYYMIGSTIVGGFWRLNQVRSARDNLNSRGMLFWPIDSSNRQDGSVAYAQQVVARLSLLATAREISGDLAR